METGEGICRIGYSKNKSKCTLKANLQQDLNDLVVAAGGCEVQGGPAVVLRAVAVGTQVHDGLVKVMNTNTINYTLAVTQIKNSVIQYVCGTVYQSRHGTFTASLLPVEVA